MTILHRALQSMPETFSSNQFSEMAQSLGYPIKLISTGKLADFLHRHCNQSEDSKRMWHKSYRMINNKSAENELQKAIDLVKANGFKVMQQITDWKEL